MSQVCNEIFSMFFKVASNNFFLNDPATSPLPSHVQVATWPHGVGEVSHVFRWPFLDGVYLPGSCWAVAVTDAVAAAHAILASSARPPAINYTQILATASSDPNDACGGGNPWNALQFLSNSSWTGGGLKANVRGTFRSNAVTRSNPFLSVMTVTLYSSSNNAFLMFLPAFLLLSIILF